MSRVDHSIKQRLSVLLTWFAVMWIVESIDWLLGGSLDRFGIRPRELAGLWGIPCAPFLHGNWNHLLANSAPFLLLGWFVILRGTKDFVELSLLVILIGGLGTWLIAGPGTVHVGASTLIFGYFGFLLFRGVLEFSLVSLLIAGIVGLAYGGLIWGVLPNQPGISWEGHLSGFLGGCFCAWIRVGNGRRSSRRST